MKHIGNIMPKTIYGFLKHLEHIRGFCVNTLAHETIYLFPETLRASLPRIGMMTDSRGLVWFVNDHWTVPSFYAYQTGTNALNSYQGPFVNEDGTSLGITSCKCIVEDKDNNMWIGTNIGPFMLETDQITATSPILTQVKVPRNDGTNYADYLLSGVNIQSIVVDKNNRKWFGTNGNGLYLIAAGEKH